MKFSLELISHKNCLTKSSWGKVFQYLILIPDEIISRKIVLSRIFCQILFILLIGLIYPHSKFCIISYVGSFWHLIVSLAFYLPKIYCASLRWEQYQYQFQMHFLSMFIFHFSSKCLCILCIEFSLTSYVQFFLSFFQILGLELTWLTFRKVSRKWEYQSDLLTISRIAELTAFTCILLSVLTFGLLWTYFWWWKVSPKILRTKMKHILYIILVVLM